MTFVVEALAPLPEVRPGDDLTELIAVVAGGRVADGDVLVVAHKVVSKAEGRLRALDEIEPRSAARELAAAQGKDPRLVQAVLDEARRVVRAERGVIITETHHGLVCANSGIDASNAAADGELILLPEDPDESARRLRAGLAENLGVRPGVVVSDSFGRAWRIGQTDVAIGAAGIVAVDDWRGRTDAAGRELRATVIAVADSIAAAADLSRRKDSYEPAVCVRGLAHLVTEPDGPGAGALRRRSEEDLFR